MTSVISPPGVASWSLAAAAGAKHVHLIVVLVNAADQFFSSASLAFVGDLVSEEEQVKAIGLRQAPLICGHPSDRAELFPLLISQEPARVVPLTHVVLPND
jgi:hypothetical protein